MIECRDLNLKYQDDHAVKDVNLSINQGEFICVLGASGSGKSSLLGLIAGIRKATSGTVKVSGKVIDSPRLDTSIILQDYGLLPWKTVLENITFPLKTRNISIESDKLKEVTELLGISKYLKRYPHQLSGGQKQRVAIARTLCLESDLILMDEAFSALDFMSKEALQDVLLHIHQKQNQTVLFVTHSIEEALYLGEKIVVMEEGRIKNVIQNDAWKKRDSSESLMMITEIRRCLYD